MKVPIHLPPRLCPSPPLLRMAELAYRHINSLVLKQISQAVESDPTGDLDGLLDKLCSSYARLRREAAERQLKRKKGEYEICRHSCYISDLWIHGSTSGGGAPIQASRTISRTTRTCFGSRPVPVGVPLYTSLW